MKGTWDVLAYGIVSGVVLALAVAQGLRWPWLVLWFIVSCAMLVLYVRGR